MAAVAHNGGTVRSVASDDTANGGSWVCGRKRDWDKAFLAKFADLEATLQENDQWLALYLENIAGLRDTRKSNMAITAALKTTTTKRRGRARIDIRDVFAAGSVRGGGGGGAAAGSPRSPALGGQPSIRSMRAAKRRSSHYGAQGNTLSMMAQMAMMPPKSPYLTNVEPPAAAAAQHQQQQHQPPLPPAKRQQSAMSLRAQRSREGADMRPAAAAPPPAPAPPALARSNTAAAKTAAAVKRLQAISGSPPKMQPAQLATPPPTATGPLGADKTPLMSPQRTASARFTPMPTLRDMLLSNRHSPPAPAPRSAAPHSAGEKPPPPPLDVSADGRLPTGPRSAGEIHAPDPSIGAVLHSGPQKPPVAQAAAAAAAAQYRAEASSPSSRQSSPEPVRKNGVRSMSVTSSEGEQELSRSEEDVRERLQRVWIALGRPMGAIAEQPEGPQLQLEQLQQSDLDALRREIDEVESLLPLSGDEEARGPDSQRTLRGDGSQDAKAAPARLAAPAAPTLAKGRRQPQQPERPPVPTAIPRKPALRSQDSNSSLSSAGSQRAPASRIAAPSPSASGTRVAEARRRFEPAAPRAAAAAAAGSGTGRVAAQHGGGGSSPVAAMRPGHASLVKTPAAAAAAAASQQRHVPGRQGPKTAQKSSTAAMREAARRAEAARAAAATTTASARGRPAPRQAQQPAEPLFRSVAAGKAARPGQRGPQPRARPPVPERTQAPASAIPVPAPAARGSEPAAKGKEPAHDDPAGWGLASMLSMISPSSWKSQDSLVADGPAMLAETPTAPPGRARAGAVASSPYDVSSPQTPYQPRPEHGGASGGRLMMPAYRDVAVPLRRSSSRSNSQASLAESVGRESFSSAAEAHGAPPPPPALQPFRQRLAADADIDMTTQRVSGASSFRSSFFSDDEPGTVRAAQGGANGGARRALSMARTQSTPDLPQQLRAEEAERVTPRPAKRTSSVASEEYTTIIPVGSDSPPEVLSDYSDDYSDEEFSPAPKRKKNDYKIPRWATTPELIRGLQNQARVNPDRIFGKVRPLRVNEIFNRPEDEDARRRPRNSSMIWTGSDALTADDELEYIRQMGFES